MVFAFFLGAQVQSSSGGWKWISTAAMGGFDRMASCKLGLAMRILAMIFFFFHLGLFYVILASLCLLLKMLRVACMDFGAP